MFIQLDQFNWRACACWGPCHCHCDDYCPTCGQRKPWRPVVQPCNPWRPTVTWPQPKVGKPYDPTRRNVFQ